MRISIEKIKNKKRKNKSLNHNKFNYNNNYNLLENMKFEEIKINRYKEYLKDFKNSKISYNKDNDLILFQFDNMNIILRNKNEKSFFFNKFINEYLEYNQDLKEDKKISFKKFIIEISNFIYDKDLKFMILDIDKDYI